MHRRLPVVGYISPRVAHERESKNSSTGKICEIASVTMVSVIIPAYNEEQNIRECLVALSTQTVPRDEYELIVVDGGSRDRTREIAVEYADLVLIQESPRVGGARNDGFLRAQHEILATTDADCLVPRDWISQVQEAFKDERVVQVFGPVTAKEDPHKDRLYVLLFNALMWLGYLTRTYYYTLGCNTAFRRTPFFAAGMYRNYDAGDDLEIPLRMRKWGKVAFDPRLTVAFSFRRYHQFGFFRTLFEWYYIVLKGGASHRYSYTHREYSAGDAQIFPATSATAINATDE